MSGTGGVGLGPADVDLAFPFHLAVDDDLRLVQVGPSLARVRPALVAGTALPDVVVAPRLGAAPLPPGDGRLVVLDLGDGLRLRGGWQRAGGTCWMFVGSPWVTDLDDLARLGLALRDFAVHDPVADYLLLLQTQRTSLADARRLTEQLQAAARERDELLAAERRLAAELDALPDVVLRVSAAGRVVEHRPAGDLELVAEGLDDVVGQPVATALPDIAEQLLAAVRRAFTSGGTHAFDHVERRDGADRHLETRVVRVGDDEALVLVRDVSERRRLEEQLAHQAFHDTLTGLANRALLADRAGHALAARWPTASAVAVLFVDLDGFKQVNDGLGHRLGDELLVAVASRLSGCVRPGDTVARLGGDEFAILLTGPDAMEAEALAERVVAALGAPFELDGREVIIGASVGVARRGPDDPLEEGGAATLLRDADVAMYEAKAAGKGQWRAYRAAMGERIVARVQLEAELRQALDRGELRVHYQPIVDLATSRTVGAEALVRWEHPERGLLPPGAFIPVAEESALILAIGTWVLREACTAAGRWRARGLDLHIAVNVSGRQLDRDLAELVERTCAEAGLPPGALTLEVTETALLADEAAASEVLHALHRVGVRVALDDFGTGYSSLSHLRRFPIDVLKIDRSFTAGLSTGARGRSLAAAVTEIGRVLGVELVAEGVEDVGQAGQLLALSCRLAQGYHFARPMTEEALLGLVTGTELPA